jgi:hypothetical protein
LERGPPKDNRGCVAPGFEIRMSTMQVKRFLYTEPFRDLDPLTRRFLMGVVALWFFENNSE